MNEINCLERFTINPGVVYTFIDKEAIFMSSVDEKLFGLNDVATELLKQLESASLSIKELCDYLLKHYEVDEKQCMSDVKNLIESLLAEQLIILKK